MFRSRFFPEGKIERIPFLILSVKNPRVGLELFKDTSGKFPVFIFFIILQDIKINRSVYFIGISFFQYFAYQFLLFDNMSGCPWFNGRVKSVQLFHVPVEGIKVLLNHLHRFEMFEACFFLYLILTLISIIFKMTYISYVPDITDLIPKMCKIAEQQVEGDCRSVHDPDGHCCILSDRRHTCRQMVHEAVRRVLCSSTGCYKYVGCSAL